jgi:hypothetical protein
VPVHIPVTVTSLDASNWFSESGLIILANQHGCAIRIARPISLGTSIVLEELPSDRKTASANAVNCISLGEYEKFWLVGLELHQPGNVWGIETPPNDWSEYDQHVSFIDRMVNAWQNFSPKKDSVLH